MPNFSAMNEERSSGDAIAEHIVAMLREAFPGRVQNQPQNKAPLEIPDITVAETAARVQLDAQREGGLDENDTRALEQLLALRKANLPARLTPRDLNEHFARHNIRASRRLLEKFAEAAIFLRMGRPQT